MQDNKGINNSSEYNEKKDDLGEAVDQVKNFFSAAYKKTAEVTKAAYQKADEKYHDPEFQQKLQNTKEKSAEVAKKGYETVKTGLFGAFNFIKNKIDQNSQNKQPEQTQSSQPNRHEDHDLN